jgi:probable HAF family extracellular repeat protein
MNHTGVRHHPRVRVFKPIFLLSLLTAMAIAGSIPRPALASPSPKPPSFTVTAIGLPGASYTEALAISGNGQVSGISGVSGGSGDAFLYTKTGMYDLGRPKGSDASYADGVNNKGVVAVTSYFPGDKAVPSAVKVVGGNGVWTRLTGAHGAKVGGDANGIDDAGLVVGEIFPKANTDTRSEWSGSHYTYSSPRNPLGNGDSWLQAVDGYGDATGNVDHMARGKNLTSGYVWQSTGSTTRLSPVASGDQRTWGMAVARSAGATKTLVAVGEADYSAAMWIVPVAKGPGSTRPAVVKLLGHLKGFTDESNALGVNRSGWVVGESSDPSYNEAAFLWRSGHMYNLNALIPSKSGWTLSTATAINNAGQIVGDGLYKGVPTGFLLNPAP